MAFNIATWRSSIARRLDAAKASPAAVKALTNVSYATLCGMALFPMIQAIQQSGGSAEAILAVVAAEGLKIYGQVATNLLANRVEAIKTEVDVATRVDQALAAASPHDAHALKEGLDAILTKLDVIEQVRMTLGEADRAWFVDTLRTELAALGNLERHQQVLVVMHPPKPAWRQLPQVRAYLEHTAVLCDKLPLIGFSKAAGDPNSGQTALSLGRVYTAQNTTTFIETETYGRKAGRGAFEREPLSALAAVARHTSMVLLGEPGGGKSAFVNHLCIGLAQLCLDAALAPEATGLRGWPAAERPLPLLVVLRDFARALPAQTEGKVTAAPLIDFVRAELARNAHDADAVLGVLDEGEAMLLLDGLDEVADPARRKQVRDLVLAFRERYPKCRCLVTCRIASYQAPPRKSKQPQPDLRLPEAAFPAHTLAVLTRAQQEAFVAAYYAELARRGLQSERADALRHKLLPNLDRREVLKLAGNPLLLTVMVLVHTEYGELPENRTKLYGRAVDYLLDQWEYIRAGVRPVSDLLREAGQDMGDFKELLGTLAYEAQAQIPIVQEARDDAEIDERVVDIPYDSLHTKLAAWKDETWAAEVIKLLRERSGILVERMPRKYAFAHRTFQEYMVAAHWLGQTEDPATEFQKMVGRGAIWTENIIPMYFGVLRDSGNRNTAVELLTVLFDPDQTGGLRHVHIGLAARCAAEFGVAKLEKSILGTRWLDRTRKEFVMALAESGDARGDAKFRAACGVSLGRMGDPRPELNTARAKAMCFVPAGPFHMGSDASDDLAFEDERPLRKNVQLDAFWIGQHPVTNKQYREFVDAGGYEQAEFWTEAQALGLWRVRAGRGEYARGVYRLKDDKIAREEQRWGRGAFDHGEPFNLDNHPAVGISWHEALAYTRWLNQALGLQQMGWRAGLPSEAEWEKAARGGLQVPAVPVLGALSALATRPEFALIANPLPLRRYPWGHEPDPDYANYNETGIKATAAPGAFARGASQYGCHDMSGNVWEWCMSRGLQDYGQYQEPDKNCDDYLLGMEMRVFRGGTYWSIHQDVRVAYRTRNEPGLFSSGVGFRVVARPHPL